MSQRSLKRFFTPQLLEVVRYTIGCGFSLVLKVALTTFISYLGLVFWLAYLIAISLLLFCSFFYHHTFTFRKKFSGFPQLVRDFRDFFVAVAALKILDYFLVNASVLTLDGLCPEDMSALFRQLLNGAIIICISGSIFVAVFYLPYPFQKGPAGILYRRSKKGLFDPRSE